MESSKHLESLKAYATCAECGDMLPDSCEPLECYHALCDDHMEDCQDTVNGEDGYVCPVETCKLFTKSTALDDFAGQAVFRQIVQKFKLHDDAERSPDTKDFCRCNPGNKEIEIYCKPCGKLMCMKCWAVAHQKPVEDHDVIDLDDAVQEAEIPFQAASAKVNERRQKLAAIIDQVEMEEKKADSLSKDTLVQMQSERDLKLNKVANEFEENRRTLDANDAKRKKRAEDQVKKLKNEDAILGGIIQYSKENLQNAAGARRHILLKEHVAILEKTCNSFTEIPEATESKVIFVPSSLNESNNLLGTLKI